MSKTRFLSIRVYMVTLFNGKIKQGQRIRLRSFIGVTSERR